MAIENLYFISEEGILLRNLPRLFDSEKFNIHCIGSKKSVLRRQKNFLEIKMTGNSTFIQALLSQRELIDSIKGLVIIGTDAEMREIAESDLSLELKLRLLSSKSPNFLDLYDSKIGFNRICDLISVNRPRTKVVESFADFSKSITEFEFPLLAKKDKGSGGFGVVEIKNLGELSSVKFAPTDFPILLQEKIKGEDIGVEAFYLKGQLVGYLYSKSLGAMHPKGPSYLCDYMNPDNTDFVTDLEKIGALTELTGMVNCSFILNPKNGSHYIFEFDPRPNAWHSLAKYFEIDISALYSNGKIGKGKTIITPAKILLLGRFNFHLVNHLSIRSAFLEIFQTARSSKIILSKDGRLIQSTFSKLAILTFTLITRKCYFASPKKLQEFIKNIL